MKKFALLILTLFIGYFSNAQSAKRVDSLLHLFTISKSDSAKVMLLIKVSAVYARSDFDSSLFYIDKAKSLADEKKIIACAPNINTAYAEYYYYHNDYQKSNEYTLKNLVIAEKNKDDKLLAKTYNNLAAIYNHFGNYKSAIEYALKCLDLSEKTKDSASFPIRNLTASNTYYNLKQYDKAILYSQRAIDFGQRFNNSFAIMMGMNNLASSYSELHRIDSAIYLFGKQLAFAQKEKDLVNTTYALINLTNNSFLNGNATDVIKYADMLMSMKEQMPDKNTQAEIAQSLALRYMMQKNYTAAKNELDSGIVLAIGENANEPLRNLYQTYSKLYFLQNNIKAAENYSYKFDSLTEAANLKELNFYLEDLEMKYETAKKEDQIKWQQAEIERKSNLIYTLVIGGIAILIISFLSIRNFRNRQKLQFLKIDELEKEKQLTATEAVLKGEEQERTRLAKDLHDGLGGMLSGIKYSLSNMKGNIIMTPDNAQAFERSIDMLDSSIREMRRVAHNMMPEVLVKFGLDAALKEYCNEIENSGVIHTSYHSIDLEKLHIEQTVAVTLYRIVQELVNNVIKHAAAKNVLVQAHYTEAGKLLTVTVEDDGKGFDIKALPQTSGIGWKNIQNRLEFLKGKLDFKSEVGKGTSILLEILI